MKREDLLKEIHEMDIRISKEIRDKGFVSQGMLAHKQRMVDELSNIETKVIPKPTSPTVKKEVSTNVKKTPFKTTEEQNEEIGNKTDN